MPNLTVSSDLDALLAKQTLADAKTYLGVTANETAITTEEARALAAEGVNATDIVTNAGAISDETTRATAAEAVNAADIATNATDISDETTRALAAEGVNATAISNETTRATTAEGQLNTAISAEITRAGTAEQANATAISDETTRATAAEGVNATAISNETTRATAAEALLAPILDATFTGTTTIPSADITTADFNAAGLGGELSWNNQEKTLDLVTGANGTTIQLGQEVVLYCRNKTATDLVDGQIVKIVGATANTPNIELAIASTTEEAHKTFGVVTQTITANNGEGFITLMGKVRDLSLRTQDGFVEGELVYLSSTVAGALTHIKPLIEVEIGRVLRTGTNNGTLGVSINNEASVYELEQELMPLITANANDIALKAPIDNPTLAEATVEGILRVVDSTEAQGTIRVDNYIEVTDMDGSIRTFNLTLPSRNTGLGQVANVDYLGYTDKNRYPMSISVVSGVTTLSNLVTISGYSQNLNLTEIYFGGKVRFVSDSAFNGCTNLVDLNLNNNLYSIGESAFLNCTGLVIPDEFPDGLTILSAQAFRGAFNVNGNETLVLPYRLATIGASAFREAYFYGLKLGKNSMFLGDNAFRDAPLFNGFDKGTNTRLKIIGSGCFQNVSVPSFDFAGTDLNTIGLAAFRDSTSLTTVTLPDNDGFTIAGFAFYGCSLLNNFSFPDSLTSVESNVLRLCTSLDSITIPAGVTEIGAGAFRDCTSLTTINCLATTAPTALDSSFINIGTTEINVPVGATGYGTTFHTLTVNYIL